MNLQNTKALKTLHTRATTRDCPYIQSVLVGAILCPSPDIIDSEESILFNYPIAGSFDN